MDESNLEQGTINNVEVSLGIDFSGLNKIGKAANSFKRNVNIGNKLQSKLMSDLKKISSKSNKIKSAAKKTANEVKKSAKNKVPVKTGQLKRSIKVTQVPNQNPNEIIYVIGSDMDYADKVELGLSRRPAKPYLHPSLVENRPSLKKEVEKALRRVTP